MSEFTQGQRWVIDSEPELGLGTVTQHEGRTVRIFFEQGEVERNYAVGQAPLTRIHFSVDDEIHINDGRKLIVQKVHDHNGLYFYEVENDEIIPETSLSSEIQLNQPFIRLMTGQLDKPNWFYFKRQLSHAIGKVWQSRLNGLLGVRANLIPHQLYVAWNACESERVRVLLSDEVGLGKTIEAGMILSRLVKLERVHRAIIAVPAALQVQWLVELVRRFSLTPELYKGEDHDFSSGQIHIVPHEIFAQQAEALGESEFDLCIVDEAHHLVPESDAFNTLNSLSKTVEHLVLLTATPEQLGMESHFARLQLLDAAKFTSFDEFVEQETQFIALSDAIKSLPESRDSIIKNYKVDLPSDSSDDELIHHLLDRHGVGRMIYRNVRSAIQGFPVRVAHPHLLENDEWSTRFEWLAVWLKKHFEEKILVICHDVENVFACENYLWDKHGIDAAVFHEQQDLIERDRAAAYFSDQEKGAQVLICSEIGSEGRNFQFCSHLICLDIPEHPDLLEQRIGRLDRIGQKGDVNVHLPYAEGSESEVLLNWYHHTLNCVEEQNPAATPIHDEYWKQLNRSLENTALVEEAKSKLQQLREEILQGRDALLEMNSCRQPQANTLAKTIADFEEDSPLALVELASELLQFYFEETQAGAYSLIPSDKMLIPSLPGIPPEGIEITFQREVANHREDVKFVSWDAPLIQGLWELLHYSELGSASVAMLPSEQLPAGHCLLEACFDVVVQSDVSAACRPFLDSLTVRSLAIDVSDNDLSDALPETSLQNSLQDVKRHLAREVIKSKKDDLAGWYKKTEVFAEKKLATLIDNTCTKVQAHYANEISRLKTLGASTNVHHEQEIEQLEQKRKQLLTALSENTHLHLAATRLIVITGA